MKKDNFIYTEDGGILVLNCCPEGLIRKPALLVRAVTGNQLLRGHPDIPWITNILRMSQAELNSSVMTE